MKRNTKLITAISSAAIALSFIVTTTASVSAAQDIPTTPPSGVSTSNSDDWSNAESWSPDQITAFLNTPESSNQITTEQGSAPISLAQITLFTPAQKQQILEAALEYFQSIPTARGRYFTSHQDFTRAQVVKISKHGYTVEGLLSLIPGKLSGIAELVYGTYYSAFQTAAVHNWGVRITLTIDSYNPTSTGMSWSASYIK